MQTSVGRYSHRKNYEASSHAGTTIDAVGSEMSLAKSEALSISGPCLSTM